MVKRVVHYIFAYLQNLNKVYNAGIQRYGRFRNGLTRWANNMADKKKKPASTPKAKRRKRVTFYIRQKGSKRRKKVTFLVSP
jgi:hypothetical protein